MERRLLTFIVASTAFFFFYFALRSVLVPPPPPPAAQLQDDEAAAAEDRVEADEDSEAAESGETAESDETAGPDETKSEDDPAPQRPSSPEWLTLGSMDPESGYYMLITLNSRGGGVERVELTERDEKGAFRYRRVDVRHGYLGYFAGEPSGSGDGLRVNVVGPGTPADMAGVKAGDIITQVAGQLVSSRDDVTAALLGTEAGDQVEIEVRRGPAGNTQALAAVLTDHPLDLIRLARDGGADQIPGNLSRLSSLVGLSKVNRQTILPDQRSLEGVPNPTEMIWNVEAADVESGQSAEFSLDLSGSEMGDTGGPISLRRSYLLRPNSYTVDMAVQLDNRDDEPQELAYRLEGPNGLTLEGWWYSNKISPNFSGAAARDVVYNTAAEGHELISGFTLLKRAKNEEEDLALTLFAPDGDDAARNLRYVGVDAQYFAVSYIPAAGQSSFTTFRRAAAGVAADPDKVPQHKERAVNTTFHLDSIAATVPPGASLRQEFQMFAGPKKPELLQQYGLDQLIYYGWFAAFARLLAGLLHVLSGVGNYALAIVLLTVIVRGAMFPLSRKAAVNAQKMQELAPELKKINEKYKDDMEGKLKAQRELQQRVGFNPLAGCLPMFLQLPIFIGLYRALSVDIELRQEAFSSATDWASNLAGPDMFWYWGDWLWDYLSGRGTGWLGPYFNILPVLVVVLFLAQQKLFMPPATDEQTAMTQKMMNVMTLMMGLFFFKVPAGLCIYFITSSLWGICERIVVKKTLPTGKHFDAAMLEGTARSTDPKAATKSQGLAERLRNQVAKPVPPVEPPHKRKRPGKKKKS